MKTIVGMYIFITKVHFLAFKDVIEDQLKLDFEYVRGDFDTIIFRPDTKRKVTVTQDGLIYLEYDGQLKNVDKEYKWLRKYVLKKFQLLDEEDLFFSKIILKKPPSVLIYSSKKIASVEDVYSPLGRVIDYNLSTPYLTKYYGDGCAVFEGCKLRGEKLRYLIETQLIFMEYQELSKYVLDYNLKTWKEMTVLRKRDTFKFKELPTMISNLLEVQREVSAIFRRLNQSDDFLMQRQDMCKIPKILDTLEMHDFTEMVRLKNYIQDQLGMTKDYIDSTIRQIEYVYKDNESKEMNILQVIFAIGTIATIVSLGAMPGANLVMNIAGNNITGEIISFDVATLFYWTAISVVIGIVLFVLLNFAFMHVKKLRIVSFIKRKVKKE
jgi:hypothetical protein